MVLVSDVVVKAVVIVVISTICNDGGWSRSCSGNGSGSNRDDSVNSICFKLWSGMIQCQEYTISVGLFYIALNIKG